MQFTRQTLGIGGALKKIGGLAEGSKLASAETEEVAHMLFGDGVGYSSLFATHPPLESRIKVLDPQFNPKEFTDIALAWSQPVQVGDEDGAQISIAGFAPAVVAASARVERTTGGGVLPKANAQITLTPKKVVKQVAQPGQDDYQTASTIHTTIPENLRAFAYAADRAHEVVYALTLDNDTAVRDKQLAIVEKYHDAKTRGEVEEIAAGLPDLHPMQRLPLAQLAFPTLRRRTRPQLVAFLAALDELIRADGQVTVTEAELLRTVCAALHCPLPPQLEQAQ